MASQKYRHQLPYSFGEALSEYMSRIDMTSRELRTVSGLHRNTIRNWLTDSNLPRFKEDVVKVSSALYLSEIETDILLLLANLPLEYHGEEELISLLDVDSHEGIFVIYQNKSPISIGPIQVPYMILEGNGEVVYKPSNITCYFDPDDVLQLPHELEEIKARISKEQEKKQRLGEDYFWNGAQPYLKRWRPSRTQETEELVLDLWFGLSDYHTYLATNMSIYSEKVYDEESGRYKTLHEKYFRDYNWHTSRPEPQQFFSNGFGVVVNLVTADKKIIVAGRPPGIGGHANVFNIAINEGVKLDEDRPEPNRIDIYQTALRGAKEELGLQESDIHFLSFGVDMLHSMWNLLGYAKTSLTAQQVLDGRLTRAIDRFEISEIYIVDFSHPRSILKFLDETIPEAQRTAVRNVWSPGALVSIYYTMIHEFGAKQVGRELDFYFNR